jgi:hypothetical protein
MTRDESGLVKDVFERRKDCVSDEVMQCREEPHNGTAFRCRLGLGELYIQSKLALCVHFTVQLRRDRDGSHRELPTGDYCAFFQRADVALNRCSRVEILAGEFNGGRAGRRQRDQDVTVFVDVGEIAQDGKGVALREIDSKAWLNPTHFCPRVVMNGVEAPVILPRPVLEVIDDDKLKLFDFVVIGGPPEVLTGEGIHNGVKGAPHVVDDVAHHKAPVWRQVCDVFQPRDVAALFRLVFGPEFIRVTLYELPDFVIKRIEVIPRPLELRSVIHDVPLEDLP